MEDTNTNTSEQKTQETTDAKEAIPTETVEPTKPTTTVDKMNRGIGTKESEKLGAAIVTILEPKLVVVPPKEGSKDTKVKEIVECMVKHPSKEDLIKVSQVRYLKNDKVDQSGLWYHEDEDLLIPKNSALAILMRHVKVEAVSSLAGQKVMTEPGKNGFLAFKAY